MMRIEKMYNVFNVLVDTETKAKEILRGWEHKEKIHEYFVIIEGTKESEYNLDLEHMTLFRSYADAEDELNDI